MPTLYICYVALYCCGHYDILLRCRYEVAHRLQITETRYSNVAGFYVWNKVKMQLKGKRHR